MNDIYNELAKRPPLSAVQLADKLDREPNDVRGELAGLVAVGELIVVDGELPNGLQGKLYEFSQSFKETVAYGLLMRKAEAATFDAPGMTNAERAIAFITQKGEATSAELHALLGLKPTESASNYLTAALKDGRLNKDGKTWKLGPGKPVAPVAPSLSFRAPIGKAEGPKAKFSATEPAVTREEAAAAAAAPVAPVEEKRPTLDEAIAMQKRDREQRIATPASVSAPQPFRVGLWSDGVLELQRAGQTVALLEQKEGEHLATFMARLNAPLNAGQ